MSTENKSQGKQPLKAVLIALALSTIAVSGSAGPASADKLSDCDQRGLCLWEHESYGGQISQFAGSVSDLAPYRLDDTVSSRLDDTVSSVQNLTSVAWVLYDYDNYQGRSLCIKAGWRTSNLDSYDDFGDKTSSIEEMKDNACPEGVDYVVGE